MTTEAKKLISNFEHQLSQFSTQGHFPTPGISNSYNYPTYYVDISLYQFLVRFPPILHMAEFFEVFVFKLYVFSEANAIETSPFIHYPLLNFISRLKDNSSPYI